MSPKVIEDIDQYLRDREIYEKIILFPARKDTKGHCRSIAFNTTLAIDVSKILKCPLCKCELYDPIFLSCSHRFCRECFQSYDRTSGGRRCPKCKRNTECFPQKDQSLTTIIQIFQHLIESSSTETQEEEMPMIKRGPTQVLLTGQRLPKKKLKVTSQISEQIDVMTEDEPVDVKQAEAINFYKNELSSKDMLMFIQVLKGKFCKNSSNNSKQYSKYGITANKGKKSGDGLQLDEIMTKENKSILNDIDCKELRKTQVEKEKQDFESLLQEKSFNLKKEFEKADQKQDSPLLKKYIHDQKTFCRVEIQGLPGNLQFDLSFKEVVCSTVKTGIFIQQLIAEEFGISLGQVSLYYVQNNILKSIMENKPLDQLFSGQISSCSIETTALSLIHRMASSWPSQEFDPLPGSQTCGKIFFQIKTPF